MSVDVRSYGMFHVDEWEVLGLEVLVKIRYKVSIGDGRSYLLAEFPTCRTRSLANVC